MKRIISLLFALVLVFAMAAPAFAVEATDNTEVQSLIDDAAAELDNILNEFDEEIENAKDGILSDYAYTSDPTGAEDGSVIEFTRENYVVDAADLFTDSEEETLFGMISDIRSTYKFDAVILTTRSIGDKEPVEYTDDYFDYNGYGYGSGRDGVMMMLCIPEDGGTRNVHISGRGLGASVFDSSTLDFDNGPIFSELKPLLSDGAYYDAEVKFLELADKYLGWYYDGDGDDNYDGGDVSVYTPVMIIKREAFAVAIGMVVAFFVVTALKRKMKTNRIKTTAANYEKPGSMNVTESNEYFVRKQVTRTAIPKRDEHDSAGGDHTGSSGASHSGGGGSF